MTDKMKNQIFETLDLFDTKDFEEVQRMKAFSYIKDFKSIYKEWRKIYLKTKMQHTKITLEEYCEDVANRAKSEITKEQVEQAIIMRRKNYKESEIAEITGIKYQKLNGMFGAARVFGLLEIKKVGKNDERN